MHIKFYEPISTKLRCYIEGYYLRKKNDVEPRRYLTFPNNYNILTFLKDADIIHNDYEISIFKCLGFDNLSLTYDYKRPMCIEYLDTVEELTIYFKPYGINQFINNVHEFYCGSGIYIFNKEHFLFRDVSKLMIDIHKDNFVNELENYLESKFEAVEDLLLNNILTCLNHDVSITEMANQIGYSRQYLSRYFSQIIGKSPNSFKKIHRFREAIQNKLTQESLTDLGHLVGFFDQSHFIKEFKNIARDTPKNFFDTVKIDKKNIWRNI